MKAVDPLGTAYKIHDYFGVWGLSSLDFLTLPLSVGQSVVEFSLGVLLLLGVFRKYMSLLVLLVMCVMTPLTLYLAIGNAVSDCGCFGDALVLTNWQTFFKNVVLLGAAGVVWRAARRYGLDPQFPIKRGVAAVVVTVALITGLAMYCIEYLPIIDFRPYKIGNNIKELSTVPEGAPGDEYATLLIYAKDGHTQTFTMENYPKEGTGWEFVTADIRLLKKGYEPPIHNFTITTAEGDDITEQVLDYEGYTFLVVAHRLADADVRCAARLNEIADYASERNVKFLGLTASLPKEIAEWNRRTQSFYPFCTMDDVTLKTIVRSNPGLVLLHNAVIIGKWSHNDLPREGEINKLLKK
ncbi:hypothetical protein AGMMS49965_25580 [Bacteroidia bacterium]|nr:hypothetical protein AGMMS49965_25580 [Bacteroidia bacterium]